MVFLLLGSAVSEWRRETNQSENVTSTLVVGISTGDTISIGISYDDLADSDTITIRKLDMIIERL